MSGFKQSVFLPAAEEICRCIRMTGFYSCRPVGHNLYYASIAFSGVMSFLIANGIKMVNVRVPKTWYK